MTQYIACAVKDRALNAFALPFFVQSVGVAVRSFTDETNRSDSAISSHPEDYDLYVIGTYNDENGAIQTEEPRCVCRAQDVKRPANGS